MVAQAVTVSLNSSTVSLPLGSTGPPASLQGLQDWLHGKVDAVEWCRLLDGYEGVTRFCANRIQNINAARGKETELRQTAARRHSGAHRTPRPVDARR